MSVRAVLEELLSGVDGDALDYFTQIVEEEESINAEGLHETLAPFLENYGVVANENEAHGVCNALCDRLRGMGMKDKEEQSDSLRLLTKGVTMSERSQNLISEAEQAAIDSIWGFDNIRQKKNEIIEVNEAASAKYERQAIRDQRKWLEDLEAKFVGDVDDGNQISLMTLPEFDGKHREKDIHVSNFNITFGGRILLEGADLRLVYGRRYGLVGRNGVGKTTLLKHMANFDIEGFPRHHRILHVKQEVQSSDLPVLQVR